MILGARTTHGGRRFGSLGTRGPRSALAAPVAFTARAALALLAAHATVALPLLLAACATTPADAPGAAAVVVKGRMQPDLGEVPEGHRITWPTTPEVPRYLYGGALTGEPNFKRDDAPRGMLQRLGRWIAGLDEAPDAPLVLQRPAAVVGDDEGRLYVSDASRQAIFVFDAAAGELQLWDQAAPGLRFVAPSGMAVQPAAAGPLPAAPAASGAPGTLGATGARLYVADAELKTVFVFDNLGRPLARIGQGLLQRPTGVARDAQSGRLFVADTHAHDLKVFDAEGRHLRTLGQRGEAAGEFNFPTHLALRGARLYVTDTLNNRVQVLDVDPATDATSPGFGRFVRSVGARGLFVGNLVRPKGVAVDGEGNIYVVESYYDSVLVFSAEGEFLLPITGTGALQSPADTAIAPAAANTTAAAASAAASAAAPAAASAATSAAASPTASVAASPAASAAASPATPRAASPATTPSAGPFYLPAGLWIDGHNRMHVADMFNGRIVLLHFLGGG